MSVRSGKETKRFPRELYKGYRIIKTEDIKYHRCVWDEAYFDKDWIDSKDVYYNFCKEGNEKLPSQDYIVVAKTIDDCKEAIDKFLEDDTLYFTKAERTKYVKAPNKKCDYAYGYDSLMKLFKEHQKADKRIKVLLEERLIDANFSYEAGLLSERNYAEYYEYVRKHYTFKEKFEVYTMTECKPLKDPKRLEAHIQSAIEEYFKEHKMDVGDTSVVVRFCEEW